MAGELVSGVAEMVAGSSQRLPMDFGDIPQLIDGATIVSHTVTCTPAEDNTLTPPTVSGIQLDYAYQVSAFFAGGDAGLYNVEFGIVLDDADATEIVRVGQLRLY